MIIQARRAAAKDIGLAIRGADHRPRRLRRAVLRPGRPARDTTCSRRTGTLGQPTRSSSTDVLQTGQFENYGGWSDRRLRQGSSTRPRSSADRGRAGAAVGDIGRARRSRWRSCPGSRSSDARPACCSSVSSITGAPTFDLLPVLPLGRAHRRGGLMELPAFLRPECGAGTGTALRYGGPGCSG